MIPGDEISTLVDNIGLPPSSINLAYNNTGVVGTQDGDLQSQILNFGAPAPIDLQIRGRDGDANMAYVNQLLKAIRRIPGVADARIQQSNRSPVFAVDIERSRAQDLGLTTRDVTNSLVVSLADSSQVAPTFWLNPANGVSYAIVTQTPQYALDSLAALSNLPISGTAAGAANAGPQVLGGIAQFTRRNAPAVVW